MCNPRSLPSLSSSCVDYSCHGQTHKPGIQPASCGLAPGFGTERGKKDAQWLGSMELYLATMPDTLSMSPLPRPANRDLLHEDQLTIKAPGMVAMHLQAGSLQAFYWSH